MTTGEKLSMLRKQNNYTQEQLAELLGVSRQAISRWESDIAFPETEKLIKISRLYGCTVDYLLKEDELQEEKAPQEERTQGNLAHSFNLYEVYYERKSRVTVRGIPLWHVNIGLGRCATGIFALGLVARGICSCGLLSMGVLSFGVLSLGLLAMGTLALGLVAGGAIALGALAFGAVAIGLFSFGGAAVGMYSVGAASSAVYGAYGAAAQAQIAIGDEEAAGTVFQHVGALSYEQRETVAALITEHAPSFLKWAAELFKKIVTGI